VPTKHDGGARGVIARKGGKIKRRRGNHRKKCHNRRRGKGVAIWSKYVEVRCTYLSVRRGVANHCRTLIDLL